MGARVSSGVDLAQPFNRNESVNLSSGDRRMAEQLLNNSNVGTIFQQMGGEGMSESVWGYEIAQISLQCRRL